MTPHEEQLVMEAREILSSYINDSDVIGSWIMLLDYCTLNVVGPVESFHVLYLDNKNRLIEDKCFATGTVDHVPVYPREVAKQGLLLNASAAILVHNHPSGDPSPSEQDKAVTSQIQTALGLFNINVHDHLIITPDSHYSFRSKGDL